MFTDSFTAEAQRAQGLGFFLCVSAFSAVAMLQGRFFVAKTAPQNDRLSSYGNGQAHRAFKVACVCHCEEREAVATKQSPSGFDCFEQKPFSQ